MLPLTEVQTALFAALGPALDPVPVLDQAGPNQVFPYVTLGEFIGGQFDTLGEQAADLEITVHVWSRQAGMKELQQLMARCKDAIDRRPLPASGFQWVDTIWEYAQTLREPDGVTRHGVLRFRIPIFQTKGS
jgi:Protein of unknown function (DUF3168)